MAVTKRSLSYQSGAKPLTADGSYKSPAAPAATKPTPQTGNKPFDTTRLDGKRYSYEEVAGNADLSKRYKELAGNDLPGLEPSIDASRPSPESVDATKFTTPEAPAIQTPPAPPIQPENTTMTAAEKALAAAKSSGVGAPQAAGAARLAVKEYLPPAKKPSTADALVSEDPFFAQIQQQFQEYFNPKKQRESLAKEYQRMVDASGLEALDVELLNVKNVIEGTEDDLRNEITKAGGFATDSQVMALANARNKQLIKNYSNLLETRNAKAEYLDKMMNFSAQDRQQADANFDRMMNFTFQVQNYRDKMKQNAISLYNRVADKVGYDALYNSAANSGDPEAIGRIERTLGMEAGTLAELAEISAQDRAREQRKAALEEQKLRADIAASSPIDGVDQKTLAKVQSSPEYKTVNAVLPAIQAIKAYKEAINKYGTGEVISGEGEGTLAGTYGNALTAWKSLAALGALSGADFALAESAIPEPSLFTRTSKQQAKLEASLNNAINQTEALTKRLSQNYPSAAKLLEQQLTDIKGGSSDLTPDELKAMEAILQ